MFQGRLIAITTRPNRKAGVVAHESIRAIADQGLEGDHRCEPGCQPDRQVTLIETEALALAAADYQLQLTHAESRRNLLTEQVPLNHLVGRQFQVGEAVFEGLELCEPCKYLEGCLDRKLVDALRHRGGLRAKIIVGGVLKQGDPIQIAQ